MTPTSTSRLRSLIGRETTAGILILLAAVLGLALANSPASGGFLAATDLRIGPSALHLDLTLGEWVQDGLLAVFFLVVGIELAQELTVGSLSRPRQAAVPMIAAVGGMAMPAAIFVGVVHASGAGGLAHGWAIPTATDIAFASAVLALFGRGLPGALRTFLLTLAIVDDLLGILVIAVFYSGGIAWAALAGACAAIAAFAWLMRRGRLRPWVVGLAALAAIAAWALMHASGVHATIAGAALGLTVPPRPIRGEAVSRATRLDRALRPWSNVVVLPLFALVAAGVPVSATGMAGQPVTWAVIAALVVGKPLGVLVTTWTVTRWTRLRLPDSVGMRDLLPIGLLCGIGFTVSMLIAGLSFPDAALVDDARTAVLVGSAVSAGLGALLLHRDARRARGLDMNEDGTPDRDRRVIR